jgi:hypothetical protein
METIHLILTYLIRLVVILVIIILVWWGVSTVYPDLSYRNLLTSAGLTSTSSEGWLPYPGSFSGIFGQAKTPDANSNVYQGGNMYKGGSGTVYGTEYNSGSAEVEFISYTSDGTEIRTNPKGSKPSTSTSTQPNEVTKVPYNNREDYIRNISIYSGATIFKGQIITGEARTIMFKDGRFPVAFIGKDGKVIYVYPAEAQSKWSVPGWNRFEVNVAGILPANTACTVIFQSANPLANSSSTGLQPIRVAIPVTCR